MTTQVDLTLTPPEAHLILHVLCSTAESGVFWGNQAQFYKRLAKTTDKVNAAIGRMKALSCKASDARKPPPPDILADALQDTMHTDSGRDRAAKTARREPMNPIEKLAALARRACPFTHHLEIACSCRTDAHNAEVDAVLAELGEVRTMYGPNKRQDFSDWIGPRIFCDDWAEAREHVDDEISIRRHIVVEITELSGETGERE